MTHSVSVVRQCQFKHGRCSLVSYNKIRFDVDYSLDIPNRPLEVCSSYLPRFIVEATYMYIHCGAWYTRISYFILGLRMLLVEAPGYV